MGLAKWFPAYLWYSGILMQALLVIMGIQSLVSVVDRHPAHTLHKELLARLSEPEFCHSTFSGQEFNWRDPRAVPADLQSAKARIEKLTYTNRGSSGRTANGNHVYRLEIAATIKDLKNDEVIQFPPRSERLVEVDTGNRIVGCFPEINLARLDLARLQDIRDQACEKAGWSRRLMCDRGSERCYPLTMCERDGG